MNNFANIIGSYQNYVSQIENDKFKPAQPLLICMEYKFGVCEKWLLSGKGKKSKVITLNLKKGGIEKGDPFNY